MLENEDARPGNPGTGIEGVVVVESPQGPSNAASVPDKGTITLSPQQAAGLAKILALLRSGRRYVSMSGYAGTGKTTLTREVLIALAPRPVIVTSFTGKAVARLLEILQDVLRPLTLIDPESGKTKIIENPAMTLHKLIFRSQQETWVCPGCAHAFKSPALDAYADDGTTPCPECRMTLDPMGGLSALPKVDTRHGDADCRKTIPPNALIIVDEASMVGKGLRANLEAAIKDMPDVQVFFVGDGGQLPPVGEPPGVDLSRADVVLTEIRRTSAGHPVMALTAELRQRRTALPWQIRPPTPGDPRYQVLSNATALSTATWFANQMRQCPDVMLLTQSNALRHDLNQGVRRAFGLGWDAPPLIENERVLIQRNAHDLGIMNGEILTVATVEHLHVHQEIIPWATPGLILRLDFRERPDMGYVYAFSDLIGKNADKGNAIFQSRQRALERWWSQITQGSRGARAKAAIEEQLADTCPIPSKLLYLDLGWCSTVHKAQGSQWRHVGVAWDKSFTWGYNQPDGHRLAYTAFSRPQETLTIHRFT